MESVAAASMRAATEADKNLKKREGLARVRTYSKPLLKILSPKITSPALLAAL